jgi:hypothetical protein
LHRIFGTTAATCRNQRTTKYGGANQTKAKGNGTVHGKPKALGSICFLGVEKSQGNSSAFIAASRLAACITCYGKARMGFYGAKCKKLSSW